MSIICDKLKLARKLAGMTQEEVADKLGISRNAYVYWEKVGPKLSNLSKLEKILKLPAGYFLEREEDQSPISVEDLQHRLQALEAVVLVLTTEYAALKSQQTGQTIQEVVKKIYAAAEHTV